MFRHRKRGSKKFEAMRTAREAKRLSSPAPEYPAPLPDLRRTIVVTDHDFGKVEHRFDLYRSNRIDCYRVEVDGKKLPGRYGWSGVIELARKAFVRVRSL